MKTQKLQFALTSPFDSQEEKNKIVEPKREKLP